MTFSKGTEERKGILKTICLAGASFLLLFLFSCSQGKERPQNVMVIGVENGPSVLDPRYATDAISTNICRLLYSGLMRRDSNSRLKPFLAEKIVQPDDVTYQITLRKGIHFHDGSELTSKDVQFTFESILDPEAASPKKGSLTKIDSLFTPDSYTIIIILKEPYAPFLGNLTLGIVKALSSDLTKAPLGTGPFSFSEYKRDEKLVLRSFPDYFEGASKISGVNFKIIPDETVRLLELKKGNIDFISNPITPAVLPWLKKQEGITVESKAGTNASYIGFNMEDPVLKEKKVRMAIAYAIDRDAIILHMLKGLAVKATSILSPANPFHNGELAQIPWNPEKSKQLLDEAGFPNPGNGNPRLTLTYKTSKNPTRKKIAEIFAEQLKEVGIEMKIKSTEWGSFYSDIKKGNFQLYSLTWVGIGDPDIYHYIFHTESFPPEGANRGRYKNSHVDALLDRGRSELDLPKRKIIYNDVQEMISQDFAYVHLWISSNVIAYNKRVQGFTIYPDEGYDSLPDVSLLPY